MVTGIPGSGSPQYGPSRSQAYGNLKDLILVFYESIDSGHFNQAFSLSGSIETTLKYLRMEHPNNPALKAIQQDMSKISALQNELDSKNLTPKERAQCEAEIVKYAAQMEASAKQLP